MMKSVAIYARVSSRDQSLASQLPELQRWAASQERTVEWFQDSATGKNMKRPGMEKLLAGIQAGEIERVVCWRLDRLGRTAKGLTALFDDLVERGIGLVSLRDGLDLSTPAGRLMANVLASVAAYETEIRAERVKAGQEAARAKGKTWGGSEKGRTWKVSREKADAIREMKANGKTVSQIARVTGLSRPTVYQVLNSGPCAAAPILRAETS